MYASALATRVAPHLSQALRAALDVLLPPSCLTCDRPVEAPGQFCAECFRGAAFITEPLCVHCGVPFSHAGQGGPERLCPACRLHPAPWRQARAALRYDGHAKRLLLPFKHADRPELAGALAPMMARAGAVLLRSADLIVPVPLHRRRLFARRYNQAALLARALARLSGVPAVPDLLRRTRATVSLGDLTATARAEAVDGAFALHPRRSARLAGRQVLLVDDVMTSGATAAACTDVLLAGGASGVDVLVAARVPDPRLR
jgi:ComF family protein